MSNVPSNLIPTRITQLPESPSQSADGYLIFVYEGRTYKIRAGDLVSGTVPDNSISATKLAPGSVTTEKIAPNTITSDKLTNGSVTPDKLSAAYALAGDNSDIVSLAGLNNAGFNPALESWPAHAEGRLFYDPGTHSLTYYNENPSVAVNIGREQLVRAFNIGEVDLLNGQMVYINGAAGGWPTISLAQADSAERSQSTLGMVTADIPSGEYGYVCTSGIVNDVDTSAYPAGTRLYLSADVAGAVTAVAPLQPNYEVEVATVVNSNTTTGRVFISVDKQPWFPNAELRDTSASIVLPTTPTVFKPNTSVNLQGFGYDSGTGILTIEESGSYAIAIQFNAIPSASNKNIYFYAEDSTDGGSTWNITRYSGRQLELPNAVETQVNVNAARYYATGTKLRFYIWGDATVTLQTTDLPGTTPGTVTKPAYRFSMA